MNRRVRCLPPSSPTHDALRHQTLLQSFAPCPAIPLGNPLGSTPHCFLQHRPYPSESFFRKTRTRAVPELPQAELPPILSVTSSLAPENTLHTLSSYQMLDLFSVFLSWCIWIFSYYATTPSLFVAYQHQQCNQNHHRPANPIRHVLIHRLVR